MDRRPGKPELAGAPSSVLGICVMGSRASGVRAPIPLGVIDFFKVGIDDIVRFRAIG